MRTVFVKLKAYLTTRQVKYRLKLRSNVHLRLKRSKKSFSALLINIRLSQRKKLITKKVDQYCIKKLKRLTILGLKKNLIRVAENHKNNFKALCFFKHSNMFRVFLNWKNLKSFVYKDELKKQRAEIQYFSRLKVRIFKGMQVAVNKSKIDKEVKKELVNRTR